MKIIQAIPRRMAFDAQKSSSVELCVAEWISGSRYRNETTVFAERSNAPPLLDVDIFRLDPAKRLSSWKLARTIRAQIKLRQYQLVVTQQHIQTAARIALFNRGVPVILQTHNFIDPPVVGKAALFYNRLRQFELQSLGGITLVSEATLKRFELDWPNVTIPRRVISNSFDFSSWRLDRPKENVIIIVGRTQEAKGILEAAEGVATFLDKRPDWKAIFILSEPEGNPGYFVKIERALEATGGQTEILTGIPFAQVKQLTETAAISIVASKWQEPFGRTALESHAGGAALISSGTGGLREISGDAAVFLPEITGKAIAASLNELADRPDLRVELATRGAARVRRLFSLISMGDELSTPSMCQRLDEFYDGILATKKR